MAENNDIKTKVILIGGNHHNGLGLVRSFGKHGVSPYGIIVGNGSERSFVRKSKYWKKTWAVKTDNEAIELILKEFMDEVRKPVVIPWSDGAAQALDLNLDRLDQYFLLPSIGGKQGEIDRLMNKCSQIVFADQIGIKMLPSEIVDLNDGESKSAISFPVILKPVASVEGSKSDMMICYTEAEYSEAIKALKAKNFSRILLQKYLEECEEFVVDGAISDKNDYLTIVKSIRKWPSDVGTGSFSEFVISEEENKFCRDVMKKIEREGFRGPIDFEFFKDADGNIYLNEINWRSSGRNFVSGYTQIPCAYIYYCDLLGIDFRAPQVNTKIGYNMNEVMDIKHVFKGNIRLSQWLKDVNRSDSFAVWDSGDLKPVISRYFVLVRNFFKRG